MLDSRKTAIYEFSNRKDAQQTPEKAYNINHDYFLHIDQTTVPFNLDQVYFTPHITEDGIYFKIVKDIKNKAVGNHHEANNQDYGE